MVLSIARPLFVSMAFALAVAGLPAWAAVAPAEVQKRLEAEAEAAVSAQRVPLRDFYRLRGWRLVWTGANEARAYELLMAVQEAAMAEGLPPDPYAVPAALSDLEYDLLVSDALLRFGQDLGSGRVSPSRAFGGLGPDMRPPFDGVRFLQRLASGRPLAEEVAALAPSYAGYARLRQAAARYRELVRAGGWQPIADGPALKPGQEDDRVVPVRQRLVATGELAATHDKGRRLDAPLAAALKRFQARHGLDEDGSVGKATLAALNVPAEERLRQIMVNLERWRGMPRALDAAHIAVNLPAATLEVVEDGTVAMTMRVVVGDAKHPTPSMAVPMAALVLNPTWTIPPKIATKEILPKLRRDPNYLAANNMRILAFPEDSPKAAGAGMDWVQVGEHFPYRLRQQAGPDNALGQVKFVLRGSDDIYLHDTPNRKAFGKTSRALSHGCVRVEKPVELAERLLGDEWQGKLAEAIGEKATRTMKLDREISVYLLYWTAWADDGGVVHFRDDLYGHDARLRAALKRARTGGPLVAQEGARSPL